MSMRPSLFTRGLSGLSQSSDPNSPSVSSPAEQRDDAKRNFLKAMRPLPTQHYWNVWFDRQPTKEQQQQQQASGGEYQAQLEELGTQIESVQDFWRYNNNTPVDQIKMRESIYLFKAGFKPIWEDRRNVLGGSWTFRVPKSNGPDVWTRVQLLAIGEKLQSVLEEGSSLPSIPPIFCPTNTPPSRRPNLRRRPLSPLQLAPHLHLAPRRLAPKVGRRHAAVRARGAARRAPPQAGQLLLQEALGPRRLQGPARAAGRRRLAAREGRCRRG